MEEAKVKAQFMAQYYGVEGIAFGDGYERAFTVSTITLNSEHEYLLLRTVEQLTDEECINLCELILSDWIKKVPVDKLEYGKRIALEIIKDIGLGGQTWTTAWKAIDYFRSIGIILPFTYIDESKKPITLQPSEIIERVWAKINNLPSTK